MPCAFLQKKLDCKDPFKFKLKLLFEVMGFFPH